MLLYLDSNVFIYSLAAQQPFANEATDLLRHIESGNSKAVSSTIIFGEVLGSVQTAGPVRRAHNFLTSLPNFHTLPVTADIAITAGELRSKHGSALRLPDAIHIASCISQNARLITADLRLLKMARKFTDANELGNWNS